MAVLSKCVQTLSLVQMTLGAQMVDNDDIKKIKANKLMIESIIDWVSSKPDDHIKLIQGFIKDKFLEDFENITLEYLNSDYLQKMEPGSQKLIQLNQYVMIESIIDWVSSKPDDHFKLIQDFIKDKFPEDFENITLEYLNGDYLQNLEPGSQKLIQLNQYVQSIKKIKADIKDAAAEYFNLKECKPQNIFISTTEECYKNINELAKTCGFSNFDQTKSDHLVNLYKVLNIFEINAKNSMKIPKSKIKDINTIAKEYKIKEFNLDKCDKVDQLYKVLNIKAIPDMATSYFGWEKCGQYTKYSPGIFKCYTIEKIARTCGFSKFDQDNSTHLGNLYKILNIIRQRNHIKHFVTNVREKYQIYDINKIAQEYEEDTKIQLFKPEFQNHVDKLDKALKKKEQDHRPSDSDE